MLIRAGPSAGDDNNRYRAQVVLRFRARIQRSKVIQITAAGRLECF
jgi:hypothetical protein